jgi:hypothetical protein
VYWIVNLIDKTVETFSEPKGDEYQAKQIVELQRAAPIVVEGKRVGDISVGSLFGESDAHP